VGADRGDCGFEVLEGEGFVVVCGGCGSEFEGEGEFVVCFGDYGVGWGVNCEF
jgi:hypothetical protein